jgi:branched-chain amino acid transport system substrate-binding protein
VSNPSRAVAILAGFVSLSCAASRDPIYIGVAGPFSEPRGASMRLAATLAAKQLNDRGGIAGHPLRLVFADDSSLEGVAVRAAQQFVDSGRVVAVVGHLSSDPTRASMGVYTGQGSPIPVISPSASSPQLSGLSPWLFRVCPSDLAHGTQLARFARQRLGAGRAAVIYSNDDYGRGVRRMFVNEFTNLGGTVLEQDPYLATHGSPEPFLSRLRRSGGPDVLVLAAQRADAEVVLRELRAAGVRWPVIGGDALVGIEADGPLAEGVRMSVSYLSDRTGERNDAFVTAYARAYGQRPDHRGAGTYDVIMLLAQAIEQGGGSRDAIRSYLASVGQSRPAYEGVTGRIAFDSAGDVPDKPVLIAVVRGGRLVTDWQPQGR